MQLRFLGATGGTTGTCHMLRAGGHTLLLDCGMFQGRREESYQRNARFGFDPRRVDAVVQSHAHIDHSGKLPMLVRHGFTGRIHATPATRDLCRILLRDCAKILQQDAEYLNRHRGRAQLRDRRRQRRRAEHRQEREARAAGGQAQDGAAGRQDLQLPAREVLPLYLMEDVEETLRLFRSWAYGEWFRPVPGMRLRFHDAGHILGSAWIEAEIEDGPRTRRLVFTGDFGRRDQPILRDPEPLLPADVYISESTYGDRTHPPIAGLGQELAQAVQRLARRGRGRLLIPAFAVGRTQNILYELNRLHHEGAIPDVPVILDSPLATAATRIVLAHPECFDEQALEALEQLQTSGGFRSLVRFTASVEESKQVNADPRPLIVIAGSGMMETGRIVHHLGRHISDPDTEILVVGFQARHTLGRKLLEGAQEVRVLGRLLPVRARVLPLLGFSAHADRDDLLRELAPHAAGAEALFLVHGEDDQRTPLAEALAQAGFARIEQPLDDSPWRL